MASDIGDDLPPTEGRTVVYTTFYKVQGSAIIRQSDVHITEGYSTFEDIRKILAVRHGFGNKADGVAKVTVLETALDPTKGF